MKPVITGTLVWTLLAAQPALADVTIRSKMDYKLGSFVPPVAADAMNKQMADMLSNGVTLRIKGKRSLTNSGGVLLITDQEKGTITVLDPKGKRYATAKLEEYADKMKGAIPAIPPEAQKMLENIKIDVKTDKTGKTGVIKDIKAEELLVMVNMEMPGPVPGMGVNMEMHMWAATPEELERQPALKELASYMKAQAAGGADPSAMTAKMFSQLPGLGDKMKAPMEQMMKASSQAVLRTQMIMRMPASATMMGAKDPNEPMTELTTDVTEISTDPIPDSVFQVPAGYQAAPLEDLVKMVLPVRPGGGPQQ
jgi:hypothetical protein